MTTPQDITIELEPTVKVEGFALHDNSSTGDVMAITFTRISGGVITAQTTPDGHYEAKLTSGDYIAEVNHTTTESFVAVRYIRFTATSSLSVPPVGPIEFDLNLTKTLNNATIFGTVTDEGGSTIGTQLQFLVANLNAIENYVQSSSSGEYSASLHPGNYTIFAAHAGDVYLDVLTVSPDEQRMYDISLEKGYRIEGTLYIDAVPTEGVVTAESQENRARLTVETDELGRFELHLPKGKFNLSSQANAVERGISVKYSNTTETELDTDMIVTIQLDKVKSYNVNMFWDDSQKKMIRGNETVVYGITVTNTGNVDDTYEFEAEPEGWTFEFSPASISVEFGDTDNSAELEVRITSPPNALVEHEDLKITAKSTNSKITDLIFVEVDISPYRGVEISLSNETPVLNQTKLEYKFEILNSGNDVDEYIIMVANKMELESRGWKALINSSGTHGEVVNATISPNSMVTFGLELDVGFAVTDVKVLVYSEFDRGTDDVLAVPVSMPVIEMDRNDLEVDGDGLSLNPPDSLVSNILIVMIFVTIACVAAIFILRRKK
jgi:hypothetical protein